MRRKAPRRATPGSRRPGKPLPRFPTPPESARGADRSPPSERVPFPIVGIGASAGGLEAFSQLLAALPGGTGMAFVIVQHLDPKHASQLPQVLARTTPMPVVAVTDCLPVEPDHVYVIPPNTSMTIHDGVLALVPRDAGDRHTPIDRFFCSLAETHDDLAIGVVLSGTGTDGTLGLREIKAKGGLTFVQDERSAKHPGMPLSAVAVADFVLPPAEIARELVRIAGHSLGSPAGAPGTAPGSRDGGADVAAVLRALRAATGVDFARYKAATVRRRIARRMFLQKVDDVGSYVRHLRETPGEAQALHDDILIQVTGFFRDPEGFEALSRGVFPGLVKDRTADEPIRIWVPGCATGEEAYSLLICLMEFLAEHDRTIPIQMFATDLSSAAIARARAGRFSANVERELSAERLRRFFVKADGRYQINKAIRDVCVFAQHDVTRDPPFSKLDLISCCNLLIYLEIGLQEQVLPIFHYALKPTGFLRLGPSEGVGRFSTLFSAVDKKHKIYARRPAPPAHLGFGLTASDGNPAPPGGPVREARGSGVTIEKDADRLVLGRFAPPGVVVNAAMEIVQFRGKTGPYLEAAAGAASLNLFKMAREGLQAALRKAVQQAVKHGQPVVLHGLRVTTGNGSRDVGLEVIPLGPEGDASRRHHLILFVEKPFPPTPTEAGSEKRARKGAPGPKAAPGHRMAELTRELAEARQHLRAVTEEHQAAMEELSAVTEEAQSSNEELQSTNEELETSKEELQATNEELTTVNDELNSRNAELTQLSNDLGNLLASIQIPIVMVTDDLRVRRITPVAERVINVASSDAGRPMGDLRLSVEVPDLEGLVRNVIETLTVQEREVRARDGRWYAVRVRPYRTTDNRIDGAVISYVDIDDLRRSLEEATAARDRATAVIETVREPLVILGADLRVIIANRAFYETFRVTRGETEGQQIFDLGNGQWNIPALRRLLERVLPRDDVFEGFEVEHEFEWVGRRTMLLNARRVLTPSGEPTQILLAIEDVTETKRLEATRARLVEREQAARMEAEAGRAKDRFLATLSHELRTPLNAMLGWTRMLRTQTLDPATTMQALEVIERNAVLQARLIDDLLDVSRIVAGTLRLETRPIMIGPVVKATLTMMQPAAEAKGIRLDAALDEQPTPVLGDAARLQQIVSNLLSNAIKFTASGGRVDVRLTRRGSRVKLRVRDTGRGIEPERLPEIFRQFGVAHSTRQTSGGLGLGLAIVRHLVELHGGTVKGESPGPGRGATFTVTLPLTDERAAEAAEAVAVVADALANARLPTLEDVRVLVVDDEADARALMRAILVECRAEVTVAGSARAALEALEGASFDVLVSDVAMPEEDGYDLIRQVRALPVERGGQIPALALTAYARIEDREAALTAGYQQHAAKPIEPADLAAAVATLAGRGSSGDRGGRSEVGRGR